VGRGISRLGSKRSAAKAGDTPRAVFRLHPHPVEWRIGSLIFEAAWLDAVSPERNDGIASEPEADTSGIIIAAPINRAGPSNDERDLGSSLFHPPEPRSNAADFPNERHPRRLTPTSAPASSSAHLLRLAAA